jgi:F420-non-reducing hydrogenase small subunit
MNKPKLALYWCAGCGGCDESVLDVAEGLFELVDAADIVFWPVAMDFKYSDVERLQDGELAAVLINGAVRMSDHVDIVKLLRRKAQLVIAHGTCAWLGGVVGLGEFAGSRALLRTAFEDAPSLAGHGEPPRHDCEVEGHTIELPTLLDHVQPLHAVIDVDYTIPGCPPAPELNLSALRRVLAGDLPPKGAVLSDNRALCDTCSRRDSKPEHLGITRLRRLHEVIADSATCFLAQGIACLGPGTRGGCVERCMKANMPCTGCFGPTDRVSDAGAKLATTLASAVDARGEDDVQAFVDSIPDPAGLFYRYGWAASSWSAIQRKRQ